MRINHVPPRRFRRRFGVFIAGIFHLSVQSSDGALAIRLTARLARGRFVEKAVNSGCVRA
jgi:hypothetical protein